jgi:hypothetical protein
MKRFYLLFLAILSITFFDINNLASDETYDANKELATAIQYNDMDKMRNAVAELARINTDKAMGCLLKHLHGMSSGGQFKAYWELVKGTVKFTDEKALDELTDFIIKNKVRPISRDICGVLKNNQSDGMVKLLKTFLDKGNSFLREQAVINLGEMRSKNAIIALIEFIQTKDCEKEDLTKRTIESLHSIAGKEIGWTKENILNWWEKHKNDAESDLLVKIEISAEATGTAIDFRTQSVQMGLRKTPKDKIIVLNSDCPGREKIGKTPPEWDHNYDHIEKILEKMKIPHTVVKKSEFDTEQYKINDKWVIIMNCNHIREHCVCPNCQPSDQKGGLRSVTCSGCNVHIPYTNILSAKGVEKIKAFVANGGYFFSEDWVLEEVLERAWKGILAHTKYYPAEKNVSIFPASGQTTHPYLKDVFDKSVSSSLNESAEDNNGGTVSVQRKTSIGEGQWKIDADSPDIKIMKPNEVVVLIVSEDLKTDDKYSGAVALTFEVGLNGQAVSPSTSTSGNDGYTIAKKRGGQVMHVLSHFGKQKDVSDEFVLQNLILNFIMEAVECLKGR